MGIALAINNQYLAIKNIIKPFMLKAHVDKPVFYGILSKGFNLMAAPITAILIATHFTAKLQGYYYTFYSIIALQSLAELGFCTVIVQFAAHEWSNLTLTEDGALTGKQESLSRLASLTRFVLKWYAVIAVIVIIGLSVGGFIFFLKSPDPSINWKMPWFLLCFLTGIVVMIMPVTSILEGCNQVSNLYLYNFYQALFTRTAMWLAIIFSCQLWAIVISTLVNIIAICSFVFKQYKTFFKTLIFTFQVKEKIHWFKDVWPMQWKIGLGTLVGYFCFYFFIPVLFKYHGPIIAGQMGMTWSAVALIPSIPGAWTSPKIPQLGMLIAQKRYVELDKLFWKLMKITMVVSGSIAIGGWSLVCILNIFHHPFALRLIKPFPMGLFIIAQFLLSFSQPMSSYLFAHKKNPLLFVSMLSGILVVVSNLTLGRYYSVMGMAVGYLLVMLLVVPIIAIILYRFRIKWH
ncbi:MAG: hypothetical protein LHV68_02165 [Elusimicrobia bacterium]|nr:hypothetical protein [Candidatus Liberimonas magnetica]